MTENDDRAMRRRGTRLPATLLAIAVIATAGVALWILLSPPPEATSPSLSREPVASENPVASKTEAPAKPVASPPEEPTAGSEEETPAAPAEPAPAQSPAETEQAHTGTPPSDSSQPESTEAAQAPPEPEDTAGEEAGQEAPVTGPAEPPPPSQAGTDPSDRAAEPAVDAQETAPAPQAVAPAVPPDIPKLPRPPSSPPLRQAPDPGLVEESPHGPVPVVGRDGREAWRVYARPFDANDKRPRIAIVLYGLGLSASATRAAIQALPGGITLAFSPYADRLSTWIAEARAAGHETLLMVPMEPVNYPQFDPGPKALLTSLKPAENIDRLKWILSRATGYVGITDYMGGRFTRTHRQMSAMLQELRRRGLIYLESRPAGAMLSGELAKGARVPFAANLLHIDQRASRPSIDGQLAETERLAKKLGEATAMAYPYPVTLERLSRWSLDITRRGFVLAPVSALVRRGE